MNVNINPLIVHEENLGIENPVCVFAELSQIVAKVPKIEKWLSMQLLAGLRRKIISNIVWITN